MRSCPSCLSAETMVSSFSHQLCKCWPASSLNHGDHRIPLSGFIISCSSGQLTYLYSFTYKGQPWFCTRPTSIGGNCLKALPSSGLFNHVSDT